MDLTTRELLQCLKFKNDQRKLGYTNQKMAEILGFNISHIEHMRSGRRRVQTHTQRLVDALLKREKLDSYELKKVDDIAVDPNVEGWKIEPDRDVT